MSTSSSPIERSILAESFDRAPAYLWRSRLLQACVILLLGAIFGTYIVGLANKGWYFLIPLALLIPAAILFIRDPFMAVMLWLFIFPYFVQTGSAAGRSAFWVLHRAMIPAGVGFVILSSMWGIRKRGLVRFGIAELAMLLFLLLGVVNICLLGQDATKSDKSLSSSSSGKPVRATPPPGNEIHFTHFYDKLFIPFCMYWLIRLFAPREADLKRLLPLAFVTVVTQFWISILSRYAAGVLPSQWLGLHGARTVGSFITAAVYTSTLLFLSLLLFQYAMQRKEIWIRLLSVLTIGLTFFGVFFSFSRGSWLGGLVVFVGLLLLYPKVLLRAAVVFGLVMVILGTTVMVRDVTWATERIEDTDTAESRIITSMTSVRMVIAKPWFGWGYDNYNLYAPQFTKSRVGDIVHSNKYRTSHNTYLTVMAEMGMVGFFLYMLPVIWWLILSIKVWWRMPRSGFFSRKLLAMLWLLILEQFIVSSLTDLISADIFGTTLWWMVMGLIANMVYPYLEPGWRYRSARMAHAG
jgi:O-antigen ligase